MLMRNNSLPVGATLAVLCLCGTVLLFHRHIGREELLDAAKTGSGSEYYQYDQDPWRAADGGSYGLWANSYQDKHGDGKLYGKGTGDHGLATEQEAPNKENKKNGWERAEFNRWLQKQGGAPNEFWLERGFPSKGSEFTLAFQRLGFNNGKDFDAFNPRADLFRSPGCQFEHGATRYTSSGHAYCGWLPVWAEAKKKDYNDISLPFSEHKGHLSADDIRKRMTDVQKKTANMVPTLTGRGVVYDDPHFYCYSLYQEGPELSECLRQIRQNVDKVTGRRVQRGKSWAEATKGLWDTHADGSPATGGASLMGASWAQLTSDLWREKPYHEKNGLDY